MQLSIILVLALGLTCSFAEEGFFYGSPALGSIQLINKANLTQVPSKVFDTHVARPSAVCTNNNNEVLFSNNA